MILYLKKVQNFMFFLSRFFLIFYFQIPTDSDYFATSPVIDVSTEDPTPRSRRRHTHFEEPF